ncbi:unnamed protein product, partial [Discosporangium mesarthrocarpum]
MTAMGADGDNHPVCRGGGGKRLSSSREFRSPDGVMEGRGDGHAVGGYLGRCSGDGRVGTLNDGVGIATKPQDQGMEDALEVVREGWGDVGVSREASTVGPLEPEDPESETQPQIELITAMNLTALGRSVAPPTATVAGNEPATAATVLERGGLKQRRS